jgi:hypothetical protein
MNSIDLVQMDSIKVRKKEGFAYGNFEEWLNALPKTFGFLRIDYLVCKNGGEGKYILSYYPTESEGKSIWGLKEYLKPYLAD